MITTYSCVCVRLSTLTLQLAHTSVGASPVLFSLTYYHGIYRPGRRICRLISPTKYLQLDVCIMHRYTQNSMWRSTGYPKHYQPRVGASPVAISVARYPATCPPSHGTAGVRLLSALNLGIRAYDHLLKCVHWYPHTYTAESGSFPCDNFRHNKSCHMSSKP